MGVVWLEEVLFWARAGVWWVAEMTNGASYCNSKLSVINISFTVFTVWLGYENDFNVILTKYLWYLVTVQKYVRR